MIGTRKSALRGIPGLVLLCLLIVNAIPDTGCGEPPAPPPTTINVNLPSIPPVTVSVDTGSSPSSPPSTGTTTPVAVNSQISALENRLAELQAQYDKMSGKLTTDADKKALEEIKGHLDKAKTAIADAKSATDTKVRDTKIDEASKALDQAAALLAKLAIDKVTGTESTDTVRGDSGSTGATPGTTTVPPVTTPTDTRTDPAPATTPTTAPTLPPVPEPSQGAVTPTTAVVPATEPSPVLQNAVPLPPRTEPVRGDPVAEPSAAPTPVR